MKSKFLPALLFAFTAIFMMASCKKTNTQGRYIPATAAVIVHVNGESVSNKLPWEEVKQNDLFKELYADSSLSDFVKSALDNPENTGIDTKKDMVFFMAKDSIGSYITFEGTIKDAAKFKTYNTAALKNSTASEKDAVQYLSTDRTTVSWDKTKFVVISDVPDVTKMNDTQNWMDKMEKDMNQDSSAPAEATKPIRNGIATAAQIYTLAEDKSMAKDEKFTELVNTTGDIHFWVNAEALNAGTPAMAALSMINMNKLYEGAIATGTVNFENGKLAVDMKSYSGKELAAIWKKYAGSSISSDMVKRLPAKDVAMFFAMNFKPEGIKEFLKLMGLDGFINMGTAFLGFNLDDFIKANKGDILLSVSDIAKDSSGKTSASVLFAASVGDKVSFDKLIAAGKKAGKNGIGEMASQIHFNSNDKYFAIGNNKQNIDDFIGKAGDSKFEFYNKIASSPFGGYVNLQYIMASMKEEVSKDSLGLVALEASAKIWDNIIISGGGYSKGGLTQHFEINLVDKTTNSLKQMNKYVALMGNIVKEKNKEKKLSALEWSDNNEPLVVEDAVGQ
jgi:hypothetical protein